MTTTNKFVFIVVDEYRSRYQRDLFDYDIPYVSDTEEEAVEWIKEHRPKATRLTYGVHISCCDRVVHVNTWEEQVRLADNSSVVFTRTTKIRKRIMTIAKEETNEN